MGFADYFESAHNDFHNEGSYTHDALGGGAAFLAVKAYEDHLAKNGQPDSHARAKEIIGGLVGAAVTQLAETKGADLWDEHKLRDARKNAEERIGAQVLSQQYPDEYSNNY